MTAYRALLGVILLIAVATESINAAEPGHTPGLFSVGKLGEATYEIPIVVPPGTAGLQPDLALVYDSNYGNGPLGSGWSISGLSAITRCAATIAQDERVGVVRYDSDDRFCLDGQRLMIIAGTYGANASRYRTEIETFQDVWAYDDNGDGHIDKFLLRDKTGRTRYYGYTEQSRIEAQGRPYVQTWLLNKVADKFGNHFEVEYAEQTAVDQNGEFWTSNIVYRNTNNRDLGRIEFSYDSNRADTSFGFSFGGSRVSRVVRLNRIDVYGHDQNNNWSRARQYRLTYQGNSANGLSQLSQVQECDATGSSCLWPTRMHYFDGENGFNSDNFATLSSNVSTQFLDVNGDGRPDQVYESNYRWTIRLSGSHDTAHITTIDSSNQAHQTQYTRVLDYNGDGRQDLLVANITTGRWEILESTGTDFILHDTGQSHFGAYFRQPLVMDLDGDALPEILFKQSGWLKFYRNEGGVYSGPVNTNLKVVAPQVLTALEYDGDGRPDIVVNMDGCQSGPDDPVDPQAPWPPKTGSGGTASQGTIHCSETAGVLSWSSADSNLIQLPMDGMTDTSGIGGSDNHNQLLDFNGDGLSDLAIAPGSDSGQWSFYVNTGAAWQFVWSGHNGSNRDKAVVFDFDGDGRQEVWQPADNTWYRLDPDVEPDGVSFSAIPSGVHSGDTSFFMDWTGDGLADLTVAQGSHFYIRTHKGSERGLLKSVENGLGRETQIAYLALSAIGANTIYTGVSATPAFPDRHFSAAIYLVRAVATDTGRLSETGSDLKVTTSYSYQGAILNQHGRGFLGFSEIEAHNANTQIVTRNTHSQVFPYVGMVMLAEQWTPDVSVQDTDWTDLADAFAPCLAGAGACVQPRSNSLNRNSLSPGEKLSETHNTLANITFDAGQQGQRYLPYVSVSTENQFRYRSADIIRRTVTTSVIDDYGNPESMIVTIDDGAGGDMHRVSTANSYLNWNDTRWCLGRLIATTVLHERSDHGSGGPPGQTRQSAFGYDSTTCQLIQEVIEPNSEQWRLQKDYSHDIFGNRVAMTVSAPGIAERTTTTNYDEYGQHPRSQTNPMGHSVHNVWDYTFGQLVSTTDFNGFVSTLEYDTFGHRLREIAPRDTLWKEFEQVDCAASACQAEYAVYKTLTRSSAITVGDRIQQITEFDQLGREVLLTIRGFDGRFIQKETHYDSAGRAYAISTPHYATEATCWTVNQYDNIGRLIAEYKPAELQDCINYGNSVPTASSFTAIANAYGNVTTYAHDGLQTAITDPIGRVVTRLANVMDRLVSVTERDDAGQILETSYDYDASGNPVWVRDANGNIGRMAYNVRGFKMSMDDPDLGHWDYNYNTLGELVWQRDAKRQVTQMTYDVLGRMSSRSVVEGTTTWYFDNSAFNSDATYHGASVGRITRVTGPGGYSQLLRYGGTHGELTQRAERLDNIWYYNDYLYDDQGRPFSNIAPAVGDSNGASIDYRLRLDTSFNEYGFPYLVREYRNQAHQNPLWRAVTMDALGNVTEHKTQNDTITTIRLFDRATGALTGVTTGTNGVIQNSRYDWNSIGNLVARSDLNKGWTERFSYDKLYRLRLVELSTAIDGVTDVTAANQYDRVGNLVCKDATGINRQSCSGGYRNFVYGSGITESGGSAGPHAVTGVSTDSGRRIYRYDSNGNLVNAEAIGIERSSAWFSFNKLKSITRKTRTVRFWYRPDDRQRWKQVDTQGSDSTTTIYVADTYQRRKRSGQADQHTYYIRAAGQVVAQIERYGDTVDNATVHYFHRDHAGSIVAVSDNAGRLIEEMSYDAWGKRRNVENWITPPLSNFLSGLYTQRGFTAHEHIDSMGVIHMNGRVYDVEVGRFLSADPFVQYPASTQAFNRYTYAQNNPLSFSDPSGFFVKGLLARIAGSFVSTVTGQAWLGHLVQGYLSSGGDLKAVAIAILIGTQGPTTLSAYQQVRAGYQARRNGNRFVNGVLGAMKRQLMGRVESIGQDYVIDTGTRIASALQSAATNGTDPPNGDRVGGAVNGAVTDSFVYATKAKFEAHLSLRISDWLTIAAHHDGRFFVQAGDKDIAMKLDSEGNLTFSAGNVSTHVQIGTRDFEELAQHAKTSFNIDLSVVGGRVSIAETGLVSWSAYLKTAGLLGRLGIGAKAGFSGVFDPAEFIRRTKIGEAGYQYRRGTTDHVDQCLKANFNLAGC